MSEMKLAEALLRRKELAAKVIQTEGIRTADLFEQKVQRKSVSEGVDEIATATPRLELAQVTAEHDFYARQLRLLDAQIQQANWTTQIETDTDAGMNWSESAAKQRFDKASKSD